MKKLLFFLLFLTAGKNHINAQGTPAFWVDTTDPGIQNIWPSWEPFDAGENFWQAIYYRSNFTANMPAQGYLTDIFLKLSYPVPAGSKLHGLKVKIGIASINQYPNTLKRDSVIFALDSAATTVYYDSAFVLGHRLPKTTGCACPCSNLFSTPCFPFRVISPKIW